MRDYVTAEQRVGKKSVEDSWFYRACFTMIVVGLVGIIVAL